jgi:hypothetical protein
MVFVMVFILRFSFLLLFFCFEVRRGQSRPGPIRVGEGQRPFHHSCAVGGGIVSLETRFFFMERTGLTKRGLSNGLFEK